MERPAIQEADEPHDVRPARRLQESKIAHPRRSPHPRSGIRNPLRRTILILDRVAVKGTVGDLHDRDRGSVRRIDRARRVDEEEVRILLAAEVDGAHDEAEGLFGPALRQFLRHDGGRQLPRREEVEAGGAFA